MRIVGVGKITCKYTSHPNHTIGYTYQVYSRQALDLIKMILPYLKTYKRERARLILKHYLKLTPRNGKYSQQMLKRREDFIDHFFTLVPENAKTRRGGSLRG